MDSLSTFDYKVIRLLSERGRMTWAELAAQLGVTPPAAAERVRKLEERGIIKGYAALIDADAVGCRLTAFIAVTLDQPKDRKTFFKLIHHLPEILECHHVA